MEYFKETKIKHIYFLLFSVISDIHVSLDYTSVTQNKPNKINEHFDGRFVRTFNKFQI